MWRAGSPARPMADAVIVVALTVCATVSAEDADALIGFQFSGAFHEVAAEQIRDLLKERMPLLNWTVEPIIGKLTNADQPGG